MKLYYAPGACSLSAHIALAEAGLSFESESVDLRSSPHKTSGGELLTDISSKGYVPVLVLDNKEVLTEGVAIVQYIADRVPEKNLAPANGSLARYRLQEWLNFIVSEIHKGFTPLWNPSISVEAKKSALERLEKRFSYIDEQLQDREYLLGTFSVADGYLFTCLNWSNYLKVSLDAWPRLQTYLARVAARPAVQQVLKDEGLLG